LDRPADLEQARTVTQAFVQHYNVERPHQGLSCGNRPPRSAFPHLPAFPPLPSIVDPDRWLTELDGLHVERKVDQHGMVSLDLKRNSVSAKLVGHHVVLQFPRVAQRDALCNEGPPDHASLHSSPLWESSPFPSLPPDQRCEQPRGFG